MLKIILIIIGILILGTLIFYGLAFNKTIGTTYNGYVKIYPIKLIDIETKLEQSGCRPYDSQKDYVVSERKDQCTYKIYEPNEFTPKGSVTILIAGMSPTLEVRMTEDKILISQRFSGSSDRQNEFKESVRRVVKGSGNAVQIQENSWEIETTKLHPSYGW